MVALFVSVEISTAPEFRRHRERGEELVGVELQRLVAWLYQGAGRPVTTEYTWHDERHSVTARARRRAPPIG